MLAAKLDIFLTIILFRMLCGVVTRALLITYSFINSLRIDESAKERKQSINVFINRNHKSITDKINVKISVN